MATTLVVLSVAAAIATWQIHRVTDRALQSATNSRLDSAVSDVDASGRITESTTAFVQVVAPDDTVISASPALRGLPPLVGFAQTMPSQNPVQVGLIHPDIDLAVVGRRIRLRSGDAAVVVGIESQGFLDARTQVRAVLIAGIPILVLLSGSLAWLLTRRAMRFVADVAEEADALSAGGGIRELRARDKTVEVVRLVDALNRMLARLDDHYASNLAAASEITHRLRTPLATLRAEAELAARDPDPAGARSALQRIVEDADRLTALVDRLLASSSGVKDIRLLSEAASALTAQWQRQARTHQRQIEVSASGHGVVDLGALRGTLDPVVENAMQHAADTSPIRVTLAADGDVVTASVINPGRGIPVNLAADLFRPWTGTTNSGVGLWLAKQAARAAGGDLLCTSLGPPDTVFEAQLPTAWAPTAAQVDSSATLDAFRS